MKDAMDKEPWNNRKMELLDRIDGAKEKLSNLAEEMKKTNEELELLENEISMTCSLYENKFYAINAGDTIEYVCIKHGIWVNQTALTICKEKWIYFNGVHVKSVQTMFGMDVSYENGNIMFPLSLLDNARKITKEEFVGYCSDILRIDIERAVS